MSPLDLKSDGSEQVNLADVNSEQVAQLRSDWTAWAKAAQVLPKFGAKYFVYSNDQAICCVEDTERVSLVKGDARWKTYQTNLFAKSTNRIGLSFANSASWREILTRNSILQLLSAILGKHL